MKKYKYKERLGLVRLFLTLASCSPLLILWAMRGTDFLSDYNMWSLCLLFIFITNGYLYHRIQVAKKNEDIERITIKNANEHTDSLLVYLVAMLLPGSLLMGRILDITLVRQKYRTLVCCIGRLKPQPQAEVGRLLHHGYRPFRLDFYCSSGDR